MKQIFTSAFALTLLFVTTLKAQDTLYYNVSFPNIVHHEANVSIIYNNITQEAPLYLRMSLSSPGRYALHQFGKNVYHVKATGKDGENLPIDRVEPEMWEIRGHKGYAKVSYTIFANYPDGTYAGIDPMFIHLNMPAVFMWARDMDNRPVKITFDLPEKNWKIATQLQQTAEDNSFIARDFQYFMDSPAIIGDLSETKFSIAETDKTGQEIIVAINPEVSDVTAQNYTGMVQKVVQEEQAIYTELPDYDYGYYTFLCSYGPQFHGDGMEHRNSTMITSSMPLPGNEKTLIRTVAHEFFHCWNVERIRPKGLEPFNFESTNMSGELWFAEGFTSYYTELVLARAGIYNDKEFGERLGKLLNYVLNSGGTGISSPVEMSKQAAFVDAATAIDQTNFINTFTSYYPYGAVIGLALDIELRTKFSGINLDGLMQAMWKKYGETEVSYTNEDIKSALAGITKDEKFAKDFFDRYVYGVQVPDYAELLEKMGYQLKKSHPDTSSIGNVKLDFNQDGMVVKSQPSRRTPLYKAGIDIGDKVTSLDDTPITSEQELHRMLAKHKPGDKVKVAYTHVGVPESSTLTLYGSPDYEVAIAEALSEKDIKRREEWLVSGTSSPEPD